MFVVTGQYGNGEAELEWVDGIFTGAGEHGGAAVRAVLRLAGRLDSIAYDGGGGSYTGDLLAQDHAAYLLARRVMDDNKCKFIGGTMSPRETLRKGDIG